MSAEVPIWLSIFFLAICIFTLVLFHYSYNKPTKITVVLILWSAFYSALAFIGFYEDVEAFPPRFALVILPVLIVLSITLIPQIRKKIIAHRNLHINTGLHTVRLPVEIILHQLFLIGMIPELMTYTGRNFDIIMGVSAPIVLFLLIKHKIPKTLLIFWNVIGLFLICFILVNGTLSAELPFQQFAFDQPNRAVLYFPFILLPATVVPIVIWTHLTDLIKLLQEPKLLD